MSAIWNPHTMYVECKIASCLHDMSMFCCNCCYLCLFKGQYTQIYYSILDNSSKPRWIKCWPSSHWEITFERFYSNVSPQKQCPGYSGQSTDLTVDSFHWDNLILFQSKLPTARSVNCPGWAGLCFWKNTSLFEFKVSFLSNKIPFTSIVFG